MVRGPARHGRQGDRLNTAFSFAVVRLKGTTKNQDYLDTIAAIERLHRRCLEVIKTELDRSGVRDINNIQSLILFNIGEEELTVGELTQRGYYLGSNVSYNVKKMVENGYLI